MTLHFKLFPILLFAFSLTVSAATLTVGPTGTYLKPCQAFAAASSGDTILIDAAGDYHSDMCAVKPSNLLIRGINGRPRIDAMGGNALGKAIWVVQGNDVIIENVEMLNCKVPDQNGAAVRAEGSGLTLRWVYFHHNQNGLLVSHVPGDILIEFSEFAYNGYGDGQTHNIYVGRQRSLTVRFSYFHHSYVGNGVKSRAFETNLFYNRVMTEASGTGSLEIDLSNGGVATLVGNLVQQGPLSQNGAMISFPSEGGYPVNNLRMAHNTFVSQRPSSPRIFSIPAPFDPAKSNTGLVINNIFQGGPVVAPSYASPTISFQNNLEGDAWLADVLNYDFRLLLGSPAINAGVATPADLVPRWQYAHPACGTPRTTSGAIDQGAYEANAQTATASGRCALSWDELVPHLTLPAATVATSGTLAARVTVDGLAPAGGVVVSLSASDPSLASVPATVTIPAGESTVVVPVVATVGSNAVNVTLTASLQGRSSTTVLPLAAVPIAVSAVTLSSATVAPGGVVTGRVVLSAPAPAGDAVVSLTTFNPVIASVPATVTVPAGATVSPDFNIHAWTASASTPIAINAFYAGKTASTVVTVTSTAPVALESLSISPVTITGGTSITAASVTLANPAPAGGAVVTLTSSDSAVAKPPASVTVAAGSRTSGLFTISTVAVGTAVPVAIGASYGGVSKSVTITVNPAAKAVALSGFAVSATTVTGGKPLNATVTLDGPAPAGGAVVRLMSGNSSLVTPPASVTVPAGATVSPYFVITTGTGTVSAAVVVTASYGAVSKSVTVTVKPIALSGLYLSGTLISGGGGTNAKVSLDAPAPAGGALVTLTSSNSAVAKPVASVPVAAGATTSAYFAIATSQVTALTPVVITASYGGVSKAATLTVKP